MATKKAKLQSHRCPTCREIVLATGADFPFCSDRCRRIDLGKWASGAFVISTPMTDEDYAEGMENVKPPHEDD